MTGGDPYTRLVVQEALAYKRLQHAMRVWQNASDQLKAATWRRKKQMKHVTR